MSRPLNQICETNITIFFYPFTSLEFIQFCTGLIDSILFNKGFGGLGSPEGYTTILIRPEKGRWVYREALVAGYIREWKYSSVNNARSESIKAHGKVIGFSQKKRERAQRNRAAAVYDIAQSTNNP